MYLPVKGHFITLIVPEGRDKGTYQTNMIDVNSHYMMIGLPHTAENRSSVFLAPGTKVILDYQDAKDIPCRFETVVYAIPDHNENLLAIKCPDMIERHQRREDIRVPVSWQIEFTYHYHEPSFSGYLNDVSGGGLSAWIPSEHRLTKGDIVKVLFEMIMDRKVKIETEVEILGVQQDNHDQKFLCSAKFISLDDTIRQKIVEFITDRQKLDIALRNSVNTSY